MDSSPGTTMVPGGSCVIWEELSSVSKPQFSQKENEDENIAFF